MKVYVTRLVPGAQNIGRPTPLGNPYFMKSESHRNEVCDKYELWFKGKVEEEDPAVVGELRRLWKIGKQNGVLKLGCYCSPLRCHGDTIAKFINSRQEVLASMSKKEDEL